MEISVEGIVALCGGSSVIISGFVSWVSQLYLNRKNETWRSETETKLKILEYQLSEKSSILNNLIEVQKSNYSFSQERRVKSIEDVWNCVSDFNFYFPVAIIELYRIYSEKEIEKFLNTKPEAKRWNDLIEGLELINNDQFIEFYKDFQKKLAYSRPFLGEQLHYSFYSFNLFYSRIIFLITNGVGRKKITHWKNDKTIQRLFKERFTQEENDNIFKNDYESLNIAINLLEAKIMTDINQVLNGIIATNITKEQIEIIREGEVDNYKLVNETAP